MADLSKFLTPDPKATEEEEEEVEVEEAPQKETKKKGKVEVKVEEKSSFDDLDDTSSGGDRRISTDFDDDDDDDDDLPVQKVAVDLEAFMNQDKKAEPEPVPTPEPKKGKRRRRRRSDGEEDEDGDDFEYYDDEDDDSDEEDEDEEEDEFEYETEEEDEEPVDDLGPEIPKESPSEEALRLQKEYNMEKVKTQKKQLIREYLHDMKKLRVLRGKNCILSVKIQSEATLQHSIIEKYVQAEKDEIARKKEAERLKYLHFLKMCESQMKKKKKRVKKKKGSKSKETQRKSRSSLFIIDHKSSKDQGEPSKPVKETGMTYQRQIDGRAVDVSFVRKRDTGANKKHDKNRESESVKVCSRAPKGLDSADKEKKANRFSFHHSKFLADVPKKQPSRSRELMNLSLTELKKRVDSFSSRVSRDSTRASRDSARVSRDSANNVTSALAKKRKSSKKSVHIGESNAGPSRKSTLTVVSKRLSYLGLMKGFKPQRKFEITREATLLARAKKRMALEEHVTEHDIMMKAEPVDLKNLNHFKFEFADPRLTARQVSIKQRDELQKLLQARKVPMGNRKWPLEIKGMSYPGRNPYGRVLLNYTRLSNHESDLPHHAYNKALHNIAYLKTKEKRMKEKHAHNMIDLQAEKEKLENGCREIFKEIIDGLRMVASLSGITSAEKREARAETAEFIEYLEEIYESFFTDLLHELYKSINMNEFALRRLHISEGKGEGAELHEFKDIMRAADKLKAEHANITQLIQDYQDYSRFLLKNIRQTDKKLRGSLYSVDQVKGDLSHMTTSVSTMIEGMHLAQHKARKAQQRELVMKADAGILASPSLFEDYLKTKERQTMSQMRRTELARRVQAGIREIYKIIPLRQTTYPAFRRSFSLKAKNHFYRLNAFHRT